MATVVIQTINTVKVKYRKKDVKGAGGRQVSEGRDGRTEGWGEVDNWVLLADWNFPLGYIPSRGIGNCSWHGSYQNSSKKQGYLKTREAKFKFPKLTLDGVRLNQEEIRPKRKGKGQAHCSLVAKLCVCFLSSRNDFIKHLS